MAVKKLLSNTLHHLPKQRSVDRLRNKWSLLLNYLTEVCTYKPYYLVLFIIGGAQEKAFAEGFGNVASNAVEPVGLASGFLYKVCLVLSIGFIVAGFLKFSERRRNPDIRLSTPIWLLIFGLLLGLLVIVQYYAQLKSNY